MPEQIIICPHCKREIPLTEAVSHQIRDELRKEFEAEAKGREEELVQREKALSAREKGIEDDIAKKLKIEREKIKEEERKKAEENITVELKDLRSEVEDKNKKLREAQELELDLRRQRRQLEESKEAFQIEMARKLDEEREKIREETSKKVMEDHRLKDLEKEKQINDMRKQIGELKRKAEQGSQQTQGEVLELELEEILKANFPLDHIEPVPQGIRGADVLQRVHNQSGQYCGTIIWESKRTKAWSDAWIEKLKDDQREVKAEIAALMTIALPKDISNFAYIDGVWITDPGSIISLTTALRINLIQVAITKMAAVGKHDKMEVLYNYLSGPEFRQKIEAIVEAFSFMKSDLDQEKRAMGRIWAKREKQLERVINNTVVMYGDMQGIIGASLQQIESLELKALTDGPDNEVANSVDKN